MRTILFFQRQSNHLPSDIGTVVPPSFNFNLQVVNAEVSVPEARQLLRFWEPAGCIVNNDALPASLFKGIPTLFTNRDAKDLPSHADSITLDERMVGAFAAKELLSLNLVSYAYINDASREYWNEARREAFQSAMSLNAKGIYVFTPPPNVRQVKFLSLLSRFLDDLPRPLGVFASCDAVAAAVLAACTHLKLNVPEDVAVIGVDNLEHICESTTPTLSSIAYDYQVYPDLLSILQDRIVNPQKRSTTLSISPSRIVRRASTLRFKKQDPFVAKACEYIRIHACEGLSARRVAELFPCSRRMAEIRFKATTGTSILQAIRTERLQRAEYLIRSGECSATIVANQCGYASTSSMYRLLRTHQ